MCLKHCDEQFEQAARMYFKWYCLTMIMIEKALTTQPMISEEYLFLNSLPLS